MHLYPFVSKLHRILRAADLIHCRPSSFAMRAFPYKIEIVVVSERVEIRDESRVLLVMLARLVAAAHDRAPPCFYRKNAIE